MTRAKVIGLSSISVGLILLIWVAVAAISIGGEASTLNQLCISSQSAKAPISEVSAKIRAMGFSDSATGTSAGEFSATGPQHLAVIYRTWLTVKLTQNAQGGVNSYHIEREGKFF